MCCGKITNLIEMSNQMVGWVCSRKDVLDGGSDLLTGRDNFFSFLGGMMQHNETHMETVQKWLNQLSCCLGW